MNTDDESGLSPGSAEDELNYGSMIGALHLFLDKVAGANPSPEAMGRLTATLHRLSHDLARIEHEERVAQTRRVVVGRRQLILPPVDIRERSEGAISGTVTFGRRFLGRNGIVHGGSFAYLFDDVLGRLANASDGPKSRTAYLRIDYRSAARIDTAFAVRGWCVSVIGRKKLMRGELVANGILLAEAEGLFVIPKA